MTTIDDQGKQAAPSGRSRHGKNERVASLGRTATEDEILAWLQDPDNDDDDSDLDAGEAIVD